MARRLGEGLWKARIWPERISRFLPPGAKSLTAQERHRRTSLTHTNGHCVPKSPAYVQADGTPVHNAKRVREIQAQSCMVLDLVTAVAMVVGGVYSGNIRDWQKAWEEGRDGIENLMRLSFMQMESLVQGERGSTVISDLRAAFTLLRRAGLWGLLLGAGANPEYVQFRRGLYEAGTNSPHPTVDLCAGTYAVPGPRMEDGTMQGDRFSCRDLNCVGEVIFRLWERRMRSYSLRLRLRPPGSAEEQEVRAATKAAVMPLMTDSEKVRETQWDALYPQQDASSTHPRSRRVRKTQTVGIYGSRCR